MLSPMQQSQILRFPDFVNEVAARTVATGVVLASGVYLLSGSVWVLTAIVYGFIARVIAGPSLSPLAQVATRIVAPRFAQYERLVPGPPKRFAQAIGATFSLGALTAQVAGFATMAAVVMSLLLVAASLEAAIGFCLGCTIFRHLMAIGVIPDTVCAACNDISLRPALVTSQSSRRPMP